MLVAKSLHAKHDYHCIHCIAHSSFDVLCDWNNMQYGKMGEFLKEIVGRDQFITDDGYRKKWPLVSYSCSISYSKLIEYSRYWYDSSVLWCCWLGGRKGIQPVKNMEWWGAGVVICLERGANNLHMVQLMPLPRHHLLLQQNPEWFILLVLAYPGCGCSAKKAVKRLCG